MTGELEKKKNGIFRKITGFMENWRKKRSREKNVKYSRFAYYMEGLDKNTEDYGSTEAAVELCDESLGIVSQRMTLIEKLKSVNEKMAELECYNSLSPEDSVHLKDLLERFTSLAKDKNVLKYQVTGFDPSLVNMKNLEDEAPAAVEEIKEAEIKQRIFKHDINYLEGEKADLEFQRERLIWGMDFIYKFTVGLVIVFGISVAILLSLYIFKGAAVFNAAFMLMIMAVVIAGLLYALRQRMRWELRFNAKKQQKAVELLNTKNAVYAHYTNFLSYEYKKFKVRNGDMLKNNLKEYAQYKHLTKRFDSIRSIMYQTEEEIERFLRSRRISNISTTVEQFAMTVSVEDKKEYYKDLVEEKKNLENTLNLLDIRQEKIWETLMGLNESDKTADSRIDGIIKSYIDEAGQILSRNTRISVEADDKALDKTANIV